MPNKHFVLFIAEDVDPYLYGFQTEESRDLQAFNMRKEEGESHGIFALDVDWKNKEIEVFPYSAGFFDKGENDE